MTFYQELQLSSTGSKQLIKNTADKKEKRRHILIYNFKVYLVMAFCVAVVTLFSKLTGSENSVVGVTVLLAVLVLRQADFGIKTTHGLLSIAGIFGILIVGPRFSNMLSPFLAFLVYVPTRILVGWLTGLIYQGLRKTKIPYTASITVANLCCPLLNTTLFMGMLVIGFYQTEYIQSFVQTLGVSNPFWFVLAFVGINGLVEAVVCFVVGTAISAALKKALKYN